MSNVAQLFPEPEPVKRNTYTLEFEQWWSVALECMKRNGKLLGKHEASLEFKKLGKHEISLDGLCSATRRYAAWCASQKPHPRPCLDPQRFLKRKVYLDFQEPDSSETGPKQVIKAKSKVPHLTPEWQVCCEAMARAGTMPKCWSESLTLVAVREDGAVVLEADSPFCRQWIQQHYEGVIDKTWGRGVVLR